MGRSAAGGGSHSSGGGGHHSTGGHSHSYSSGRGSSSHSSFSFGSSSSHSSHSNSFGGLGGRRPHYYSSPMYSYGGNNYFRRRGTFTSGNCCCTPTLTAGCGFVFIALVVIFMISGALMAAIGPIGTGIGKVQDSTIVREKLDRRDVIETAYIEDQANWITSTYDATKGMKKFFERTGVQPFLIISESIEGNRNPSLDQLDQYLAKRYEELFSDEQHILVLFFDNGTNWYTRYNCGSKARLLMDEEACEILLDYFDYYVESDMNDDDYFSTVFDKASERIMSKPHFVTDSKVITLIAFVVIDVVVLIIVILLAVRRKKRAG